MQAQATAAANAELETAEVMTRERRGVRGRERIGAVGGTGRRKDGKRGDVVDIIQRKFTRNRVEQEATRDRGRKRTGDTSSSVVGSLVGETIAKTVGQRGTRGSVAVPAERRRSTRETGGKKVSGRVKRTTVRQKGRKERGGIKPTTIETRHDEEKVETQHARTTRVLAAAAAAASPGTRGRRDLLPSPPGMKYNDTITLRHLLLVHVRPPLETTASEKKVVLPAITAAAAGAGEKKSKKYAPEKTVSLRRTAMRKRKEGPGQQRPRRRQ